MSFCDPAEKRDQAGICIWRETGAHEWSSAGRFLSSAWTGRCGAL